MGMDAFNVLLIPNYEYKLDYLPWTSQPTSTIRHWIWNLDMTSPLVDDPQKYFCNHSDYCLPFSCFVPSIVFNTIDSLIHNTIYVFWLACSNIFSFYLIKMPTSVLPNKITTINPLLFSIVSQHKYNLPSQIFSSRKQELVSGTIVL